VAAKYFLYRQSLLNFLDISGQPTVQSVLDTRAADGWRVHSVLNWSATLVQILFAKDEPLLAPSPTVNVAPPQVTVQSPTVNVDAPVVHVDAPQVRVDAPVVNVDAPQIAVHMPETPAPTVNVSAVTQPSRAQRTPPPLKQGPRPE